jgi:hypothetical protein
VRILAPGPCQTKPAAQRPHARRPLRSHRPAHVEAARARGASQSITPALGRALSGRTRSRPGRPRSRPGRPRSRPGRGRSRITSPARQARLPPIPALPARSAQAALGARPRLCSAGRRVGAARAVQRRMHPRLHARIRPRLRACRAARQRPSRPRSRPASRCRSVAATRFRMHRSHLAWQHHVIGTNPNPTRSSPHPAAPGAAPRLRQPAAHTLHRQPL